MGGPGLKSRCWWACALWGFSEKSSPRPRQSCRPLEFLGLQLLLSSPTSALAATVSLATPSPTSLYKDPYDSIGLPRWLSGKESTCQCRRHRFNPWVGKIPWRKKWPSIPVFLPGESNGQRSLVGYRPLICKELGMT